MFRFPSVICTRCTGFFCLAIIKGPPNDIYCIIEEPSKHYFTEKVSYSLFNSVSSCIIVRVLFPQVGHRTHFIVSIFFSILTSKYYPTKFIKFIATVFKFLLLDYLTAEKECFHIGLLFTCHFFVFLILYPPVQQIA